MTRPGESAIAAPDASVHSAAVERMAGLAKPPGSLGVLEELATWWAAVRGTTTAPPPRHPLLAVFAADHGVSVRGVSAYPATVTAALVRTMVRGGAAASVLAREHGVSVRVLDVAVDREWPLGQVPPEVTEWKVGRGSASIDTADALDGVMFEAAVAVGRRVADEAIDSGVDLLLTGDLGIANTTPATAVIATLTGLRGAAAGDLAGRGTGVDDEGLDRKRRVVTAAVDRVGDAASQPWDVARRVGGADIAALLGLCLQAAARRTPVLLDGIVSGAAALTAAAVDPGVVSWLRAGHRSTEPAHAAALQALGLRPIVTLDMRLGEGTGALIALPVLRSAVTLMRDMATLADVLADADG